MVSLGGTSLSAVMATNDDELLYGDQTRIVTAHDREVHSTYPRIGKHNLMVGKYHSAGAESANNLVIGEGVIVENGVKNSASIGRNNVVIRESNKFDIGGFITITDGVFLSAMRGAVTASDDGKVVLGGALRVENGAVDFAGTVQIGGADGWTLGLQESEALGKYDLAMRSATGTAVVFCNDFVPAVMNFTGQHRCVMFGEAPDVRSVLVATGAFDCPDSNAIDVDEAIPVVSVSDRAMDKRAFGVLSKVEAKRGLTRRIQVGNLCFIRPRKRADEWRVVVNGSGEGAIRVCGEGGDIEVGDLLCTSSARGIAMRQADDIVRNYTCAKATGSYAFGESSHAALIGCTYRF